MNVRRQNYGLCIVLGVEDLLLRCPCLWHALSIGLEKESRHRCCAILQETQHEYEMGKKMTVSRAARCDWPGTHLRPVAFPT